MYYITGNHDEKLRKFSPLKMGNISVVDKLVLNLDGKKHGSFMAIFLTLPFNMQNGSQNWAAGATIFDPF